MSIYTKTGDAGHTSLITKRIPKSTPIIELLGKVDQVNACFGLISILSDLPRVYEVQNILFEIGTCIAKDDYSITLAHYVQQLELDIDQLDTVLPPLKNFILPGGTELSARFHLARTNARFAEHALWSHNNTQSDIHMYLNRLSDWCFAQARKANFDAKINDTIWTRIN